jgi:hypothetical protein
MSGQAAASQEAYIHTLPLCACPFLPHTAHWCVLLQLAWPDHKSVHKQASAAAAAWLYCTKRGKGRSATMPNFDWTGPLRPAPIGPSRQVGDLGGGGCTCLKGCEVVVGGGDVRQQRRVCGQQ